MTGTEGPVDGVPGPRALGNPLFVTTLLAAVALDQATKQIVIGALAPGERWPAAGSAVGRFFTFTHVHNTGMAFGIGQGRSAWFAVIAALVVIGLAVYQARLPRELWWLRIALGLQAGGAIGNLIDRLSRGYVTDFFDFQVFPVFNVADSAISIGVALLAWHLWHARPAPEPGSPPAAALSPEHSMDDAGPRPRPPADVPGASAAP